MKILALLLAAVLPALSAPAYRYPEAKRAPVVERYFGVPVADPYRWLESPQSPDTRAWIDAQNALSRGTIDGYAGRAALKARLTKIWDFPRHTLVERKGSRYFYGKNDGLQNQSVLYWRESLSGEAKLLLDPNSLSPDGTIAVSLVSYSWDGKHMAYALSAKGSDWQELRIKRVAEGTDYPETLSRLRFSDVVWAPDGSGFYYNRYPDESAVAKEDENRYNKVYWHALGTPQSADSLVYERPDQKDWSFDPWVTEDGRYLILTVWQGTDPRTRLYYKELGTAGAEFVKLFDAFDAKYAFLHNQRSKFFIRTNKDAPRGKIIALDLSAPKAWQTIVPESEEVLGGAVVVGGKLAVASLKDAHSRLRLYGLDGRGRRDLALPTLGSVAGISGEAGHEEFFYGFTSFLFPSRIYRYDLKSATASQVFGAEIDFPVSDYETSQAFYPSKDGTKIPIFLVHKKGLARDGNSPALLYGYGGFKVSLTPSFSIPRLLWLENGGVLAVANLRGGDEYGEDWHQAGMLSRKQNVFDDFHAAAEWLAREKYTSAERLAIQGGSNGGLLVAAAMLQRPELYGAVLCQVPVADMLRYHRFTVGHMWIPEYGSAEADAAQFRNLLSYSPLHNVRSGRVYPPILVTAADTDDRVVPAHAKKLVATLQHADAAGLNPILLRYDVKAGHGGGKPTAKIIDEQADIYAFLFKTFNIEAKQ